MANGAPDINDGNAARQKIIRFLGHDVSDPLGAGLVGVVVVDHGGGFAAGMSSTEVPAVRPSGVIKAHCADGACGMAHQRFDLAGFLGRCFSSSYIPNQGEPGHEEFKSALEDLFQRHNEDGFVDFIYDTKLYFDRFQD